MPVPLYLSAAFSIFKSALEACLISDVLTWYLRCFKDLNPSLETSSPQKTVGAQASSPEPFRAMKPKQSLLHLGPEAKEAFGPSAQPGSGRFRKSSEFVGTAKE